MKDKLRRFPFTSTAAVLAVIIVLAALTGDINLIELPLSVMSRIEKSEFDDILTAFVPVIVAQVIDTIRAAKKEKREAKRQAEIQVEQVGVVKVTMRTVQDIVNNCLNQLQLLRMDAEDVVLEESLRVFDEAIQETSAKLKALGNMDVFAEKQMAVGTGLDVNLRGKS